MKKKMKFCVVRGVVTLAFAFASLTVFTAFAQPVEKVADLLFTTSDGIGQGGYAPNDRFTQVGSNLWFTTTKGGTFDAGTISRFNLETRQVEQVASFDNNTGKAAEGSILVIGDEGYFTTLNGGVGNVGTIAKINLTNGLITTLYDFPTNTPAGRTNSPQVQFGAGPRGNLTLIGTDLWALTSSGGVSNFGTVLKLSLTNNAATFVTNLAANPFGGQLGGGQAYGGLVKLGDAYYYTTQLGGNTFKTTNIFTWTLPDGSQLTTSNSLTLGGGTLSRMTFDEQGNPVFTNVVNLPGGFGNFANNDPLPVGTNSLYFATTGQNAFPGSLVRYDVSTGFWTNLFVFPTNTVFATNYGNVPGHSALMEWQNEIYFTTREGGVSNKGVIAKYNIASNKVIKLADLDNTNNIALTNPALGSESGGANGGTIVEETNRFYAYFPIITGGANNRGTILRVTLPAPPIVASITPGGGSLQVSWTGGYEPFTVQSSADLTGTWTNLFEGVTNRSVVVTNQAERAFFRILGSP